MKKLVSLLVALVLCVSCVAIASAAGSKTVSNLTNAATQTSGLKVEIVNSGNQQLLDIAAKEIEKLTNAASVEEYFGELKDVDGNVIDLKAELGAETLNVFELHPLLVSGYDESMGYVTLRLAFATPYEAGEKVIAVIGFVTENADGTQNVDWTAFVATVVDANTIEITVSPEMANKIQNSTTLLAVVSK